MGKVTWRIEEPFWSPPDSAWVSKHHEIRCFGVEHITQTEIYGPSEYDLIRYPLTTYLKRLALRRRVAMFSESMLDTLRQGL